MRLDSLVRHIAAADFMSFREIALECLKLKGYKEVSLTDGWKDGGSDFRIFELPPNPSRIGVQVTVDKTWKPKLRSDAIKCKERLSIVNLNFVCSRRIPESEFEEIRESIWASTGVHVHRLDSQAIASTFFSASRTGRVLEILGVQANPQKGSFAQSSPRAEAALSFAFFGQDAHSFRELVFESAVISVASDTSPIDRHALTDRVASICQVTDRQKTPISSAIDRLIQRRDLSGPATGLRLSEELQDAAETMKVLRAADEINLRNDVNAALKPHCASVPDGEVDTILRDLGALMIDSARDAIASMTADGHASEILSEVRTRIRHLHATLDALGVSDGAVRDELLEQVAELASGAPIGKHLFAGELFLSMLATETPALIKAFGARTGIQVILDASVAIPMLCTLLYEVVPNRFSVSARHVYDQLLTHGQSFVLPLDYLEEVATHLMRAWYDYSEFVDLDRDLANSENSFVSHYVSMKNCGRDIAFSDFVEGFGLDESLRKADFYVARDRLSRKIQRLFDRYGIEVTPLGTPTRESFRRAEEGIAYAVQKFGRNRPTVLQKHDARTIAFLHDRDRSNDEADVLCTWDTVHFWMRENEPADWLVMNPAVLGDVFSIARTEDYDGRICTPVVFASLLSDEASELGARVMDTIARIERGNELDATLISEARRFKEDFASRELADTGASKIVEEWAKWKGKYCERR